MYLQQSGSINSDAANIELLQSAVTAEVQKLANGTDKPASAVERDMTDQMVSMLLLPPAWCGVMVWCGIFILASYQWERRWQRSLSCSEVLQVAFRVVGCSHSPEVVRAGRGWKVLHGRCQPVACLKQHALAFCTPCTGCLVAEDLLDLLSLVATACCVPVIAACVAALPAALPAFAACVTAAKDSGACQANDRG